VPKHIPALCEYFPKRGKERRNGFGLYEQGNGLSWLIPEIIDHDKAFPRGWKWPQIHRLKGVVHLPYQLSYMSIFEQYMANVPQIFPGKKFLADMFFVGKWKVLGQVSNYQLSAKKPNKTVIPINGTLDPNDWKSREVVEKLWLENADYYDKEWMKNILYFNSIDDLKMICRLTDFEEVSERMRIENIDRKIRVYKLWREVLATI
jgi:hypothetical protein